VTRELLPAGPRALLRLAQQVAGLEARVRQLEHRVAETQAEVARLGRDLADAQARVTELEDQ